MWAMDDKLLCSIPGGNELSKLVLGISDSLRSKFHYSSTHSRGYLFPSMRICIWWGSVGHDADGAHDISILSKEGLP